MYFFDNVTDSSLLGPTAFTCFVFGLFLLLLVVLDWILDGHKFVEDHDIFDFFGFYFDSFVVVEIVSGMNFDIVTERFDSTVHVQLFIFQVVVNLFVWFSIQILSNEML